MEPNVFTLFEDQRVVEAVTQISRNPEHVHYHIPVIDRQQVLKGFVCIRELMRSEPESLVVTVTTPGVTRLLADSRREAIVSHPGWQLFPDLPVVDTRGRVLGMLSYRILRHLESEVGEPARGKALSGASKALGELYWLGISAFVRGTSSLVASDRE
jgi:Mg/Co/Ni transporter MgtE